MQEEKTVPIDTSGESLDVTLEEENTKKYVKKPCTQI